MSAARRPRGCVRAATPRPVGGWPCASTATSSVGIIVGAAALAATGTRTRPCESAAAAGSAASCGAPARSAGPAATVPAPSVGHASTVTGRWLACGVGAAAAAQSATGRPAAATIASPGRPASQQGVAGRAGSSPAATPPRAHAARVPACWRSTATGAVGCVLPRAGRRTSPAMSTGSSNREIAVASSCLSATSTSAHAVVRPVTTVTTSPRLLQCPRTWSPSSFGCCRCLRAG